MNPFRIEKRKICFFPFGYIIFKIILKIIVIYLFILFPHIIYINKIKIKKTYVYLNKNIKKKIQTNLKVALCTMGRTENLYAKEFVDYYLKLGINHIFIYDDNEPNTEKISNVISQNNKDKVTIFENINNTIKNQPSAFTDCYEKNKLKYDWFLMIDMDEFIYLREYNRINEYLSNKIFDKCDIIKLHRAQSTDNDLIHYENKSLFERFKPPYLGDHFIKSLIRGNISGLKYGVHSPRKAPLKNISCINNGQRILKTEVNSLSVNPMNFDKAFLIHFRYKSTEEFISKYKRGYRNWFASRLKNYLNHHIYLYFQQNKITLEKINFIEKELNIKLRLIKLNYYLSKFFLLNIIKE